MELKQLRFLVACAETRSFSKAANLLYTTQSNVSKVIRSLENELHTELFHRTRQGINLTEPGKRIYSYAKSTLESAKKIVDLAESTAPRELRVSCNPSSWMAAAFCEYYKRNPEIRYYMTTASTAEIIGKLSADIDQLSFVYVMEEQMPGLRKQLSGNHINLLLLKKTRAMLYFGNEKAYEAFENTERTAPAGLVQGYEDDFTLRSYIDQKQKTTEGQSSFRISVTTNSDYFMSELLANTDLGNISSDDLSEKESSRPRYKVPLYEKEMPVNFCSLFRNDKNLDSEAILFLNFIKKRLQDTCC